jgi:hypothetical protein
MPIKPQPFKHTCELCHWSKVIAPRGDVRFLHEWPGVCPACGGELLRAPLSGVDSLLMKARELISPS